MITSVDITSRLQTSLSSNTDNDNEKEMKFTVEYDFKIREKKRRRRSKDEESFFVFGNWPDQNMNNDVFFSCSLSLYDDYCNIYS